jgi:predicted CoA-binding protein
MTDPVAAKLELADPLIAVVGATDHPGKYGGIIYRHLKAKGYRVVPINPGRETVDGDQAYASVSDLEEPPDIIDVVVPPSRTLSLLDEFKLVEDAGVWIQPGAADRAVREKASSLDLSVLIDDCIMVIAPSRTQE